MKNLLVKNSHKPKKYKQLQLQSEINIKNKVNTVKVLKSRDLVEIKKRVH